MFATRPTVPLRAPGRPRSAAAVAIALLALLALLTGCGSMASSGGQSAEAPLNESKSETGGGAQAVTPAEEGAPGEAGGSGEAGDSGEAGGSGIAADVPVAERELVHTADLAVEVQNVQQAAEKAAEWTESAGGYVAAENVQTADGSPPHASLTLHVPQDRYEKALEEYAELGSRSSLDRSVEDVTEEVADVDSRVDSAEASLERLRGLLDEAESVEDVLAIEQQISTRQEDLEALQARQKSLAQQTTYGTVRLDLAPPATYVEDTDDDTIGFLGGLQRGWQALVTGVQALLVALGWLLPFLLAAAAVGVPAWLAWRRRRAARSRRAARRPAPAGAGAAGTGADPDPEEGAEPENATEPERSQTAPAAEPEEEDSPGGNGDGDTGGGDRDFGSGAQDSSRPGDDR